MTTISSLAITCQTNNGSDKLIYIKEFKSNKHEVNDDIDIDLLQSILVDDNEEESDDNPTTSSNSSSINAIIPTNKTCSIRHQFLLQSAFEKMKQDIRFENQLRVTFNRQIVGSDYMWIGLLCIIDEYRFYGYITNTNTKIILSVEDNIFPQEDEAQKRRDDDVKKILENIHGYYVDYVQNPFSAKNEIITSQRFDDRMEMLATLR